MGLVQVTVKDTVVVKEEAASMELISFGLFIGRKCLVVRWKRWLFKMRGLFSIWVFKCTGVACYQQKWLNCRVLPVDDT